MKKLLSAWFMLSVLVLSIIGVAVTGSREDSGDPTGTDPATAK